MILVASLLLAGTQQIPPSRYQPVWPLNLPSIRVDHMQAKEGVAQSFAFREGLQGRVLWIDGTANLERCSSDAKIASWLAKIADVGFNTIVYDIKPIVGRTMYPSKYTEQMTEWKGQSMPAGFDPLKAMVREAKKNGLSLFVSLNAFSEGHSYAKRDETNPRSLFGAPGWGYEHIELQTWKYFSVPVLKTNRGNSIHVYGDYAVAASTPGALPEGHWYIALDKDGVVIASGRERPSVGFSFVSLRAHIATKAKNEIVVGSVARVESQDQFIPFAYDIQSQIPLMMNPHHPEVQDRALLFVEEVLENYDVDGLMFDDRLRFGGIDTDFSPYTRAQFEKHVGRPVHWPDDIYKVTYDLRFKKGIDPGPLFDAWLVWRAQTMATWVAKARKTVQKSQPGTLFGIYAGSWYGDYAKYGSNYGSQDINAGFPFLTRHYRQTGFAKSLDVLMTGCYYPEPTIVDAMKAGSQIGRTVEAAGVISNRVAGDQAWTYAGIMLSNFYGNPAKLGNALQAATATTQGVMVFDLSHEIDQFWPVFKTAFSQKRKAPHQVPGLLTQVRTSRQTLLQNGYKLPPFPFYPGAPGAGF